MGKRGKREENCQKKPRKLRCTGHAHPPHPPTTTTTTNKKTKKNNKKKKNKILLSSVEPSCPYCFKILLNQEKMKLHMNQCKRNQEATPTNNLKFKIKLQSDSNSILEKIT